MVDVVGFVMSLPSATLALLTSLLIVGCATNEPPTVAQTQTQTWHRDDISTHGPKKRAGSETVRHPDPSGGAMSGSETEWSKVNPRHGGFQ